MSIKRYQCDACEQMFARDEVLPPVGTRRVMGEPWRVLRLRTRMDTQAL